MNNMVKKNELTRVRVRYYHDKKIVMLTIQALAHHHSK